MTGINKDKARKKIARCLAILQRDMPDIHPSETPTKFLFIGNAGLTTNADELSLVQLINSTGSDVEAVTLIPGKQYSFATFGSVEYAKLVLESAHGVLDIQGSVSPVYMAYVDKVPSRPSQQLSFPPGLTVVENFITEDEESMLLKLIDWEDKPVDKAEGSSLKHRQVRHFGYEFKYGSNSVDKENPLPQGLPESMRGIMERIVKQGCAPLLPDQLTVNRYLPGQGIPPHVDTHRSFTNEILSLSTGGGVVMDFRLATPDTEHQHCKVYLPPRSLCIMTGPARYDWTHGISPRMTDVIPNKNGSTGLHLSPRQERISFTFRKVREGECNCNNTKNCDSTKQSSKEERRNDIDLATSTSEAMKLEQEHVLQVYDEIAGHFSQTRHKPWPQVLEFVTSLPLGAALLDVGCGNGKYLGHNDKIFQIGCDTSHELMKICNTRGFEVLTSNCLQLPFRDSMFNAVICIAVIHHLASEERRLASIKEMARILHVGGQGLVYVWAMEQKRGKKKSAYLKQNKANRKNDGASIMDNENNSVFSHEFLMESSQYSSKLNSRQTGKLPVHVNRTEFIQQDMLVPWKLKPQGRKENKDDAKNKTSIRSNEKSDFQGDPNLKNNAGNAVEPESKEELINTAATGACKKTVDGQEPIFHRYYHVFKQGELENLCDRVEGLKVVKSYYDEGNWCVIFEKLS